ncbi:diphosphomevalonate decarboxylase [Pustulibacterium marinum]|uniref:Diphosphomevalonate decarboxylase n=1 Tax=Pustulibacterium marinum TaxID=1224947 RepID=A0A1I7EUT9_9FLAO|nr:diphosphomevalonate decarboxylase [Pustulibacterium marinum]SFU27668.1 diphosphomevalonate decarboxylase [Pustulibacterium marinum]
MSEKEFVPSKKLRKQKIEGKVTWKSPSNIALVKYWGKKPIQLPANTSLSFTLNDCVTTTTLSYKPLDKTSKEYVFDVLLDGESKKSFRPKIEKFFENVERYFPFLKDYEFSIETSNSFPHSSGIASSASGMSALALCLMSMEKEMAKGDLEKDYFDRKASFVARLGSGSACRSVQGPIMVWGENDSIKNSSNELAIPYPHKLHEVFTTYQDCILLVDKGEKVVSSTVGHDLMHYHPFAKKRFKQAEKNIATLKGILKHGDLKGFIKLVESEALTLHAMMMTSMPYFILMKPNTLEIIQKVWEFRKQTKLHLCFTLDAGANVHLLYPEAEKDAVLEFIKNELVVFCENQQYICDKVGLGAVQL